MVNAYERSAGRIHLVENIATKYSKVEIMRNKTKKFDCVNRARVMSSSELQSDD